MTNRRCSGFTCASVLLFFVTLRGVDAVNLLPEGGLSLTRDRFDGDAIECGKEDAIQAKFSTFVLPTSATDFAFIMTLNDLLDSSSSGVLMVLEGVTLKIDVGKGVLLMDFGNGDDLEYNIDIDEKGMLDVAVSRRQDGAFKVCTGDQSAKLNPAGNVAAKIDASGYTILAENPAFTIPKNELILGDPSLQGSSATLKIHNMLFFNQSLDCAEIPTVTEVYEKGKDNVEPELSEPWQSPESTFVDDTVTVSASAVDADGDPIKLKMTFYGVPRENCDEPTCGNYVKESAGPGSGTELHAWAKYRRPGRFVVRIEATDMQGHSVFKDHEIIVRKIGDVNQEAKCCRNTGMLIALQSGRPIHSTKFRDSSIYRHARDGQFRWSEDYLNTDDLEAERLFDYGFLAPEVMGPLTITTCHDTRVAGSGSAKVMSYTHAWRMLGHNKRMLIINEGLPWGGWSNLTVSRPECATHFTDWPSASPYKGTSGGAACSYTCTAEGSASMLTNTGAYDRMAEAIMEVSYGRASFSWDVAIPDETIELPLDSSRNLFAYHDEPAREFVRDVLKIKNIKDKFFEVMVLSPWPHHNNPGQLAWASGSDEFPAIFILRCDPQLYYLIHETGHRFGLPHSVVYKVEDGTDPPTDPLSPGVIENSYSDRLDIMACCKGTYNLYSRILAGWVQGNERTHLTKVDVHKESVHRFTLWPFDRVESRGNIMAVTMRLAEDKALAFGFRSVPYYQDIKIGRWPRDRAADVVASEDMRNNVQGLSVGYSYRYSKRGEDVWSIRGLLDFNLLFGEWPESIPSGPNRFPGEPAYDAFAQLKEGYPWFHKEEGEDTGIMVMVERLVDCSQKSGFKTYNYTVRGFYGFRGEFPFQEEAEKHDYTGYSDLKCMELTIRTGVTDNGPPGTLNMEIRFADEVAGGVHLEDHCGFHLQPRLEAVFPDGTSPDAIIWKDNLNQTFATDETIVRLPPLATVVESSTVGASKCSTGCPNSYTVKAASADGRHARAEISLRTANFNKYAIDVKYTFYDKGGMRSVKKSEEVDIIKRMGTDPLTPRGVHLFGNDNLVPLLASSKKIEAKSLPNIQCSKQWTLSFLMKVNQLDMIVNILSISQLPFAPNASTPMVQMAKHNEDCEIVIHWNTDKVALDVTRHLDPESEHELTHVMIVRDRDRLGAWINGEGNWFPGNVWCFPSRNDILFCDHDPTGSGMGWGEDVGLWIGDHMTGLEAGVKYMRMYNYAIPADSWKAERDCMEDCRNVFLLEKGSAKMTTVAPTTGKVEGGPSPTQEIFGWLKGPWGPCSKHCGGGERLRTVSCAKTVQGKRKFVPAEFCMEKHRPSTRQVCNLRACTSHYLTGGSIVDASQGVCGSLPDCGIQDDGAVLCRNSAGYVIPTWECGVESLQNFRSASKGIRKIENQEACLNLASHCSSDTSYRWAMSPWSKCSRQCNSGTQKRELLCLSTGGIPVHDSLCNSKPNAFSKYSMSRTCNSRPCRIFTWKVGRWEKCHGEETGYSLRDVQCINSKGSPVSQALCVTEAPPDEELCVVEESSARCRPLNSLADEEDCSAHGDCTLNGCHCKQGYHGNYCEIVSECGGVMGRSGACCETGILDDDSHCCSANALLDKDGRCCNSGKLDACGICDGHGAVNDILGECCTSSTLDQTGVCCKSGLVDECGVCDGDSASCGVFFMMRFFLARPTADSLFLSIDSDAGHGLNAEEKNGLKKRLVAALSDTVGLHTSQIVPGDIREASNSTEPKSYAVISFENTAISRRLLQDSADPSAGAWDFGVLVLPTSEQPLFLESIISKLTSRLSSGEPFVSEDSNLSETRMEPVLVDLRNPSRLGICGNGMCEIGEQEIFANGVVGESACPEDCPFPIRMCPGPAVGGVGTQKEPCGLNGRCLMASGTCDCFKGYSGDACDTCTPGYTESSNLCQKQYINGTWTGARLPTFAIETRLDETVLKEDSKASIPLALIAGIAAAGVAVICSIVAVVVMCLKAPQLKPPARDRSRNQPRGVTQGGYGVYTPSGSPSNVNKLNVLQKKSHAVGSSPKSDSPSIRVISFPQRNQLAQAGPQNMNIEDNVSKNTFSRLHRLSSVLSESNSKLTRAPSLADDMIGNIERITLPASPERLKGVKQEQDGNCNNIVAN